MQEGPQDPVAATDCSNRWPGAKSQACPLPGSLCPPPSPVRIGLPAPGRRFAPRTEVGWFQTMPGIRLSRVDKTVSARCRGLRQAVRAIGDPRPRTMPDR